METEAPVLVVPTRGLVVLIGASGSGKSTFARTHFGPTEVLSSDAFRALVSDDEGDQSASAAAFAVLETVLAHRLRRGRLSVVDATNTSPGGRRSLLRLAAQSRRPAVAIAFDLPEALCQRRNAARPGRVVDAAVVRHQLDGVRRSLADPERLLAEGFAAVYVLNDEHTIHAVCVVRDPAMPRPPAGPVARDRFAPDDGDDGRPRGRVSRRPTSPRGRTV
jgi:protein phosphatase